LPAQCRTGASEKTKEGNDMVRSTVKQTKESMRGRTVRRAVGALGLAGLLLLGPVGPAAAQQVALLQGLDKITARISTFEAPLGETVRFGSLEIVARACNKRPPEEPPESAAFLEIIDLRPDSDAVKLFTGWMFASSPALSAVEHPVYDVWVIDCRKASSSASVSSEGN
jgi:hypothetical protein